MNPSHNTPQPLTDADLDAMQALAEADHAATEAFRTASHASRKVNDAALNAFFVFNAEARPFVPRAIAALRAARATAEDVFQEAARLSHAQPASGWVPVSQRPANGQQVLILLTWDDGSPRVELVRYEASATWQFHNTHGMYHTARVTHWMPLPAPPQPERPAAQEGASDA